MTSRTSPPDSGGRSGGKSKPTRATKSSNGGASSKRSTPVVWALSQDPITEGELRTLSTQAGRLLEDPAFQVARATLRRDLLENLEECPLDDDAAARVLRTSLHLLPNLVLRLSELYSAAQQLDATVLAQEKRAMLAGEDTAETDYGFAREQWQ